MRYFLIFFNLIFSFSVIGQESKTDSINTGDYDFASLEILYGSHLYKNQLNNQLNSFNSFELYQPIQSIGLSFTNVYVINRKREQTMHMSYSQILPQSININDTIDSKISGYSFSLNLISYDITSKCKSISTPFGLGFKTGRLKIKSISYKTQKNPFFAPTFFLNPRLLIGKIVLGIRFDYQFDISKTGWRSVIVSKNDRNFSVDKFNQSGFMMNISLGWGLF